MLGGCYENQKQILPYSVFISIYGFLCSGAGRLEADADLQQGKRRAGRDIGR